MQIYRDLKKRVLLKHIYTCMWCAKVVFTILDLERPLYATATAPDHLYICMYTYIHVYSVYIIMINTFWIEFNWLEFESVLFLSKFKQQKDFKWTDMTLICQERWHRPWISLPICQHQHFRSEGKTGVRSRANSNLEMITDWSDDC